jgi:predicted Rossmann fold flavoprotein
MDNVGLYDLAILGAGAAGLMAAIRAAECGRKVVLVEKNRRPGVKILISGGTRCNLTNARGLRNLRVVSGPIDPAYDPRQARGARSIQDAFGPGGKFLGPSLKALGVEDTVAFFEREGVATKVEGNGKVFPVSDRATDVLDALLRRLGRSGARLLTNAPSLGVEPSEDGFEVRLPDGPIRAHRVVVAAGGQSYPGSGTTGDGYAIARGFGHTIVEPRPALVPLRVEADWVPGLKGLTVPDLIASIRGPSGPALHERREAMLFAHFGLTGPAILDVSRAVARHDGPDRLDLALDFLPDLRTEAIDEAIQSSARSGKRPVASLLPEAIPRRLADALLAAASVPPTRTGPELSREERRRLVGVLKGLRLPVTGTLGFAKAEVTSGGVALDEVDSTTLESRRQPGLHFAGEVLDLDGLIGGYNFQAAWSMGWLVGGLSPP